MKIAYWSYGQARPFIATSGFGLACSQPRGFGMEKDKPIMKKVRMRFFRLNWPYGKKSRPRKTIYYKTVWVKDIMAELAKRLAEKAKVN